MLLSFSRMLFIRFTTSMLIGELIECHQEAFAYLGGWPTKAGRSGFLNRWNAAFGYFSGKLNETANGHRLGCWINSRERLRVQSRS